MEGFIGDTEMSEHIHIHIHDTSFYKKKYIANQENDNRLKVVRKIAEYDYCVCIIEHHKESYHRVSAISENQALTKVVRKI